MDKGKGVMEGEGGEDSLEDENSFFKDGDFVMEKGGNIKWVNDIWVCLWRMGIIVRCVCHV